MSVEQRLRDGLTAELGRIDPDVEKMLAEVESEARRQRTRRTVALVAAAAVAAVAGVVWAGGSLGWLIDQDDVQPADQPANLDGGWVLVEDAGLEQSSGFKAVTEVDGRLIAVGGYRTPILTSTDGLTWTPADTPLVNSGRRWLNGVSRGGPGALAYGDPGIWASPDGLTWTPAVTLEGTRLPSINAIAAGGPGLIAVEARRGAPLWTSVDGVTWERSGTGFFGDPFGPLIQDITSTPTGLAAAGTIGVEFEAQHLAIWTSADGNSWSRAPHDTSVFPAEEVFEVESIVAGGPGLLVVGNYDAVWASVEGQTWTNTTEDVTGLDGQVIRVVNIDGDVIAVGSRPDGAAMWTTGDGLAWQRVTDDSFGVANAPSDITDVIETSIGLVAVGTTDGDFGADGPSAAAVWLRDLP